MMQNTYLLASHKLSWRQLNMLQYNTLIRNSLLYRVSGCLTMTGVAECGVISLTSPLHTELWALWCNDLCTPTANINDAWNYPHTIVEHLDAEYWGLGMLWLWDYSFKRPFVKIGVTQSRKKSLLALSQSMGSSNLRHYAKLGLTHK